MPMNRIPLDTPIVSLLGLDDEYKAVGEAHRNLLAAIQVAQRKLDASPLAPHIAKSVSFDHGAHETAVLRVEVEGVFAVIGGAVAEPVKPPEAPEPEAPEGDPIPTADEIRARAKKLGFDLGTRPLRSIEQKTATWAEMDRFETHKAAAELPQAAPSSGNAEPEGDAPEDEALDIDRLVGGAPPEGAETPEA